MNFHTDTFIFVLSWIDCNPNSDRKTDHCEVWDEITYRPDTSTASPLKFEMDK